MELFCGRVAIKILYFSSNLARHSRGSVEAKPVGEQLRHCLGKTSWGTAGAQFEHNLRTKRRKFNLGHSWGKGHTSSLDTVEALNVFTKIDVILNVLPLLTLTLPKQCPREMCNPNVPQLCPNCAPSNFMAQLCPNCA